MVKVLFLCTGNSCRSQMAEGLLRWVGGSVVEAFSAGTTPQPVNPFAVRALAELGIDISRQRSKSVDIFVGKPFDYLITLCDSAREACPIFPGATTALEPAGPGPGFGQRRRAHGFLPWDPRPDRGPHR
jgi:arsenate reductase (thioredoxin)